jgi:regulator of sigma E protease
MSLLIQNIWWYLVLIGVMILVHELGHYWAARLFDVKVETFSFGFGPRLFGFRRGETDFRFSAILFGGYVKMAGDYVNSGGEQGVEASAADPRSLYSKPRWQRMIIAFAGPGINIILAVVLLAGLFMVHYPKMPTPEDPIVGFVTPDGAAAKAGVMEGDQLVQLDGKVDPTWEDVAYKEIGSARKPFEVWVKRKGEKLHFSITPTYDERIGAGYAGWGQETDVEVAAVVEGMDAQKIGIRPGDILVSANGEPLRSTSKLHELIHDGNGAPVDIVYARRSKEQKDKIEQTFRASVTPTRRDGEGQDRPQDRWMIGVQLQPRLDVIALPLPQAFMEACRQNTQSAKLIFKFLEGMVERRMSPKSLEGPIRIAQFAGDAAREGPASFFGLMAAVSLNLAVFNLLPIPILDGGVMLLLLVEMLLRRDLDLRVREAVVRVGFVFLMMVVVFVLYNDISKIMPPG